MKLMGENSSFIFTCYVKTSSTGGGGTRTFLRLQDFLDGFLTTWILEQFFFFILDFIAGFACDGTSTVIFHFEFLDSLPLKEEV